MHNYAHFHTTETVLIWWMLLLHYLAAPSDRVTSLLSEGRHSEKLERAMIIQNISLINIYHNLYKN